MKGIHPVITKEKQKVYEKIFRENEKLENTIPFICGIYGRACGRMDGEAYLCVIQKKKQELIIYMILIYMKYKRN